MNKKYFIYVLFVTIVATWTNWATMFDSSVNRPGASAWRSGGWGSGGGHK